jgi:hypothetical protein
MNKSIFFLLAGVSISMLSGCTEGLQAMQKVNDGLATVTGALNGGHTSPGYASHTSIAAPQKTDQTANQICAEAKNNNQRAVDLFTGKMATFEGKVKLSQGLSYQNVMYLYTTGGNQIALSDYPDTSSLNNGQTLKVNGVITGITTLYSCSIFVKYYGQ